MNYQIQIASLPHRDAVVAEIWLGDEQFAELRHEGDSFRIELYGPPSGPAWDIPYDDLMHLLAAAKRKLIGLPD